MKVKDTKVIQEVSEGSELYEEMFPICYVDEKPWREIPPRNDGTIFVTKCGDRYMKVTFGDLQNWRQGGLTEDVFLVKP